ncbi:MAG: Gmad2 immunoglobulin-like domain-containing protein [Gaiellaceae bacterium]
MRRLVVLTGTLLLLAGCGGGDDGAGTTDTQTPTEPAAEATSFSVYWLLDGKVWPVPREVEGTQAVAQAALDELFRGPTEEEAEQLSFKTAVPDETEVVSIAVQNGVARVELSEALPVEARAQVVYTLTQFPTVGSVEILPEQADRGAYSRADFENLTPAILVESPRFFEDVGNPVRATGTANTFEATFQYELTDTDGRIVDEGFVTATSGSGERGTFDFTTAAYEIPFDGIGALFVFELSAEDGSRINLVEIPVRMSG